MRSYSNDGRDSGRRGFDRNSEQYIFTQTVEELELEYKREATGLGMVRDKEKDEENMKQREAVREIRENHMKKLALLRESHVKQWEDFLHLDVQRRPEQAHSCQLSSSAAGFGGYKQPPYPRKFNSPAAENHSHYGGSKMVPMDSKGNFPNSAGNSYESSKHHDSYRNYPHQRREEYGEAYNRY